MSKTSFGSKPVEQQWGAYQAAWTYFNEELFQGSLKPCILNFSRKNGSYGFFWPGKWASDLDGNKTHEISLNPDLLEEPLQEVMGTLVHEMCHQWQFEQGTPPRAGYHDRQWAAKMEAVGLIPSSTGEPDGRKTGQKMSHYIQPGGPFQQAFQSMPSEYSLPFKSWHNQKEKKEKKRNKLKYTCPGCETNVWGKPELNILCGECQEPFQCEDEG